LRYDANKEVSRISCAARDDNLDRPQWVALSLTLNGRGRAEGATQDSTKSSAFRDHEISPSVHRGIRACTMSQLRFMIAR
jgi:hypothetical protein